MSFMVGPITLLISFVVLVIGAILCTVKCNKTCKVLSYGSIYAAVWMLCTVLLLAAASLSLYYFIRCWI